MSRRIRLLLAWLCVACATASAQAPAAEPQVRILSPGPDTFVSGPTLLRARIVPETAVSTVVFRIATRVPST